MTLLHLGVHVYRQYWRSAKFCIRYTTTIMPLISFVISSWIINEYYKYIFKETCNLAILSQPIKRLIYSLALQVQFNCCRHLFFTSCWPNPKEMSLNMRMCLISDHYITWQYITIIWHSTQIYVYNYFKRGQSVYQCYQACEC